MDDPLSGGDQYQPNRVERQDINRKKHTIFLEHEDNLEELPVGVEEVGNEGHAEVGKVVVE